LGSGMEIALEARHLVKQYPGVLAVDDVSFDVRAGSCFGLLGPNGAGKTTTVEIMEGVTPATSGEVYYFGRPAGNATCSCPSPSHLVSRSSDCRAGMRLHQVIHHR